MNNNEIKKKYNIKIKEIKLHNKLYFDKNNPKISDFDYDQLKKEIIKLEKQYSFLENKDSHQKWLVLDLQRNFLKSNYREKNVILIKCIHKRGF